MIGITRLWNLFELSYGGAIDRRPDRNLPFRDYCQWFAAEYPEFGKEWKWYWNYGTEEDTELLEKVHRLMQCKAEGRTDPIPN